MRKLMTQPCDEWAEMLAVGTAAELSSAARAALQAHLATCAACAAVKADYLRMDAHIRALPAARPLDGLPPALLQLWAEENRRRYSRGRLFPSWSTEDDMRLREDTGVSTPAPTPQHQNRHVRRLVSGISAVAAVVVTAIIVTALVFSRGAKPTTTGTLPGTAPNSQGWEAIPHLTNTPGLPVIAPSNPQVVYEAQFGPNGPTSVTLQRSDNDGVSWHSLPVPAGITQVYSATFFVSPLNAQMVFVGFEIVCPTAQGNAIAPLIDNSGGGNVCSAEYFSTDGGTHWNPTHWPVHGTQSGSPVLGYFAMTAPLQAQGNRLYALLGFGTGDDGLLVTSTDGGATWQFADQPLAAQNYCVADYALTPTGTTVFAVANHCSSPGNSAHLNGLMTPLSGGANTQLWRSDDAGAHWASVGAFTGGNNIYLSLNHSGQPVLYDDGFVAYEFMFRPPRTPGGNTPPAIATRVSVDGGKTWLNAPGVSGQFSNSGVLGTLNDGSIIEAFPKNHQSQLFSWKAGDAAWHQLSGNFQGIPQSLLVIPSGGHDTLWLVTQTAGGFNVQHLMLS